MKTEELWRPKQPVKKWYGRGLWPLWGVAYVDCVLVVFAASVQSMPSGGWGEDAVHMPSGSWGEDAVRKSSIIQTITF